MNAVQVQQPAATGGPGVAGLELFDSIPGWAIVHAAHNNRHAPLICTGEIVVAERGRGWLPTEGGLFIAEYVSPPTSAYGFEQRTWEIVTTWEGPRGWWAGTPNRGRSGTFFASDGPYADPCALAGKLIGRVVGMVATRNLQVRS